MTMTITQTNSAIRQAADELKAILDFGGADAFIRGSASHDRIGEIGQEVHEAGGFAAMQAAWRELAGDHTGDRLRAAALLEKRWDGVGHWHM